MGGIALLDAEDTVLLANPAYAIPPPIPPTLR
jgi:hypothetical protein